LIERLAKLVAKLPILADPAKPELKVIVGHYRALLPRLLETASSNSHKATVIPL